MRDKSSIISFIHICEYQSLLQMCTSFAETDSRAQQTVAANCTGFVISIFLSQSLESGTSMVLILMIFAKVQNYDFA